MSNTNTTQYELSNKARPPEEIKQDYLDGRITEARFEDELDTALDEGYSLDAIQNVEETTDERGVKETYRERMDEWKNRVSFRLFVYASILTLIMINMTVVSKLYDAGLMSGDQESMAYAFNLFTFLGVGMLTRELVIGGTYAAIAQIGKHRGFAFAGLLVAVGFGLNFSTGQSMSGENARVFSRLIWMWGIMLGSLVVGHGALFERDLYRIRDWIRGAA